MIPNNSNDHPLKTFDLRSATLSTLYPGLEDDLTAAQLAEIWARRAYALAEPPPAEIVGQTLDVLVCLLNGERYGLEVSYVREIYPLEQLTPVPRTPDFVAGIFSARGRLICVVDLRAFLGLPNIARPAESKIVVVATDDLEIGLLADEVTNVLTIFKDELQPALTTQFGNNVEFTQGITPDMLVVLDLNTLLSNKHLIIHQGNDLQ